LLVLLVPALAACGIGVVGTFEEPGVDAGTDATTAVLPEAAAYDATDEAAPDATEDAAIDADADAEAAVDVCVPRVANAVSWWPGDGDRKDYVGSNDGANGTQNGATAVTYGPGKVGQAFALNGTSYVQVPNAASLQITTALTIEAWIYPTALGGRVVDKITAGTADGYLLDTVGSKLRLIIGAVSVSSVANLPTNAWVHVAGTWDGANARVYVDGVLAATSAVSTLPSNNLALRIGADSTGANRFAGTIDEVGVYNRALSTAELAAIVLAGSAPRCR
jgi:hypothetical protein